MKAEVEGVPESKIQPPLSRHRFHLITHKNKTTMMIRLLATLITLSLADAFSRPAQSAPRSFTRLCSTTEQVFPEGISKTVTQQGIGRSVRPGDNVVVKYVCNAVGSDTAFSRSDRQRFVAGDGIMIPGFDVAIRSMKEGERSTVRISDPKYGYGAAGVPPFVPPNAQIEVDLEVLNIEENVGLSANPADMDALGMDGPISRPRTPGAIAAAYEQKMKQKAMNAPKEKEGIEWVVDKIKTSYFFGLFEGETGQEAPWYLKPSITFPIAFLVVGAAFWASLAGGAISERGMPSTDELDEIIISSDFIRSTVVMAFSSMEM